MPIPEQIQVKFGEQGDKDLEKYVFDRVTDLKQYYKQLHESKLPILRNIWQGIPREETKNFPWKNASNLVVRLVRSAVDTLTARVLGSVYETQPLILLGLVGDWAAEEQGDEQRSVCEEFMNLMGTEPSELDLYRVEYSWWNEAIGLGNSYLKNPWEQRYESRATGVVGSKTSFVENLTYEGPKPEKMAYECFMASPKANTLEDADFKIHVKQLKIYELKERMYKGMYDKKVVEEILKTPDRYGVNAITNKSEQTHGLTPPQSDAEAEWDIYECHFWYWFNPGNSDGKHKKVKIIYSYHLETRKCLRAIFDWVPAEVETFLMSRLGYSGDGLITDGFAELLKYYQEEASSGHNQRVDNRTLQNTSVLRVDPGIYSTKYDSFMSLHPNAVLPGAAGEIEVMQLGSAMPPDIQGEMHTIGLAHDLAGTDQATGGSGGGTTNPKKGVYSAMGTFSVMQAGNRRQNINTTDMRYAHIKLCRSALMMYAHFGIGKRAEKFGKQADLLRKALESIKSGRMAIPVKAATASINKELEKQNDILLTQVMDKHYQMEAAMLQSLANPQVPQDVREYLVGVIRATNALKSHILRNFNHDDVSRLLPGLGVLEKLRSQQNGSQSGGEQRVNGQQLSAGQPTAGGSGEEIPSGATESTVRQVSIPGAGTSSQPVQ